MWKWYVVMQYRSLNLQTLIPIDIIKNKKNKPTKLFAESKSKGSNESCSRCLHTHYRVSSWQEKMLKVKGSTLSTAICHSHSNLGNYGIGRKRWKMVGDLAFFSSSSLMLSSTASSTIKGRGRRRKRNYPRGHSRKVTAALSSCSASPLIPGQHHYRESLRRLTFCQVNHNTLLDINTCQIVQRLDLWN